MKSQIKNPATPPLAVAPFDSEPAKKHQAAWAKHLGVEVEYTNSIGMKFRLIPPGEFLMGSTPEEVEATLKLIDPADLDFRKKVKTEVPRHKVILTKAFYLGVHEVTQKQYEAILMANTVRGQQRSEWLTTADGKLVCLRALLRLAYDLQPLAGTQVEHAVQCVEELGRSLGAWKKRTDRPAPLRSVCRGVRQNHPQLCLTDRRR